MSTNAPMFTAADLIPRLMAEFNLSLSDAQKRAGELVACQPRTKATFWHWWTTGIDLPLVIEGFSKAVLMELSQDPIIAFLNLDWIEREGKIAAEIIRRYPFGDLELPD